MKNKTPQPTSPKLTDAQWANFVLAVRNAGIQVNKGGR